jgi:hypothetical protein
VSFFRVYFFSCKNAVAKSSCHFVYVYLFFEQNPVAKARVIYVFSKLISVGKIRYLIGYRKNYIKQSYILSLQLNITQLLLDGLFF